MRSVTRCAWATREPNLTYHDLEWGVPVHEDRLLFEFLILEGAQAGLSWETVLKKRDNYRSAFEGFDPVKVAAYNTPKVEALLSDPGIIRNRLKILATIQNAQAFLKIQDTLGSFDHYLWQFVSGKPIVNQWESHQEVPASTALSDALSKDLKQKGFKFVGSTICYSFMQAVGMINDHTIDCFRHHELIATP